MMEMSLARLRQLAAHEVGHTLGLMHNYSASTVNRSSVMDYPPPYVKLKADGTIDLSDAYAKGIGAWDKVSIAWGYSEFAPGTDEHAALDKILDRAFSSGLRYLTDQDARPAGSSSSVAHLWDSGSNAVDELNRTHAGSCRGVASLWRKQYSRRRAACHPRRRSGAHLHVAPLPGGSRQQAGRRNGLHVRSARRRRSSHGDRRARRAAAGPRRGACHAQAGCACAARIAV